MEEGQQQAVRNLTADKHVSIGTHQVTHPIQHEIEDEIVLVLSHRPDIWWHLDLAGLCAKPPADARQS